jgi:hypothetical protein
VALHELEELGEQEQEPASPKKVNSTATVDGGEAPVAEQVDVHEGMGGARLAHHEGGEQQRRERERGHARELQALLAELLHAPHEGDHAGDGQRDPGRVPGPGSGLRDSGTSGGRRRARPPPRQLGGEHPAPVGHLEDRPADDRAEGEAARRHRGPDAEGDRALALVGKHRAQDGERRGHDHRAAHAEEDPRRR